MIKILYICTHNRCRSILSEAVTNGAGKGVIQAKSAGSQPVGQVHPLSLKYLEQQGYKTDGLASHSWDDYEDYAPDIVITVCDSAASEVCPAYFGKGCKLHWGLADPSKLEGSEEVVEEAFLDTIAAIEERVQEMLSAIKPFANKSQQVAAIESLVKQLNTTQA